MWPLVAVTGYGFLNEVDDSLQSERGMVQKGCQEPLEVTGTYLVRDELRKKPKM